MSAIGYASRDLPVFVSHRSTPVDRELAEALRAELDKREIHSFLDEKDIHPGDAFTTRIIESIRRSQLVVVFFPKEMSAWVHFEAACAYFDRKLLPVAVDGGVVPPPYDRIHHESVHSEQCSCPDHPGRLGSVDDAALERVAEEVARRVRGDPHVARKTKFYRTMNRLFFSGLPILFAAISAFVLFGLAPGSHYQHINHLHVVFGAVILGGQFFISMGFARVVASPSFHEREYGFSTTERLLTIWAIFVVVQPALGLFLVLYDPNARGMRDWVWLSLVLYLLGLLCTGTGYVLAKRARELDRDQRAPQSIAGLDLAANALFLLGFILMVAVINLMLHKPALSASQAKSSTPKAIVWVAANARFERAPNSDPVRFPSRESDIALKVAALHADVRLVAELGRALACGADDQASAPGRASQRRRTRIGGNIPLDQADGVRSHIAIVSRAHSRDRDFER